MATFYTMYKREPCGEHLVSVCTNALCAVLGGDAIYARLAEKLGVGHEETAGEPGTPGSITLETAECLAACDHAPVLQVNYEFFDNQTRDAARIRRRRVAGGPAAGTHPWRAAHRLPDGRTGDRRLPAESWRRRSTRRSASVLTLRGNRLAEETHQSAPAMPDHYDMPALPEKK